MKECSCTSAIDINQIGLIFFRSFSLIFHIRLYVTDNFFSSINDASVKRNQILTDDYLSFIIQIIIQTIFITQNDLIRSNHSYLCFTEKILSGDAVQ